MVWLVQIGGMCQPACGAQIGDKLPAGGVNITMVNRKMGCAPVIKRASQRAVRGVQKGPVKKAAIRHQSPSKTGFSFATKAL